MKHRLVVGVPVLTIGLVCAVACDPHHTMRLLPHDAAVTAVHLGAGGASALGGVSGVGGLGSTGGATALGGVTSLGGNRGVGGWGTAGVRGTGGGAGGSIYQATGGRVARDADVTDDADRGLRSGSITVTALIDGQDLLHIMPSGLYWEHITRAGPGMHAAQTLPTIILSDTAGSVGWCPQWANGCNTCDGSCGELRDRSTSAVFPLDVVPGTLVSATLDCSGRNSCTLLQVPTSENPEAIIDMDDVAPSGPSSYAATLSFTYVPRPG